MKIEKIVEKSNIGEIFYGVWKFFRK